MASSRHLILALAIVFSSTAQAEIMDIPATQTFTTAWADAWDSGNVWCDVGVSGLAPAYPPAGQIRVGYHKAYDPGTDPFPCGWKRYYEYHGILWFPLNQIPFSTSTEIRSATLRLRWLDSDSNVHIVGRPNEPTSCATALYEGPLVWPPARTATPFSRSGLTAIANLPELPRIATWEAQFVEGNVLEINVTSTIARWYRFGGNKGLLLANNRPVFGGEDAHSFICNSRYGEAVLRVDYRP